MQVLPGQWVTNTAKLTRERFTDPELDTYLRSLPAPALLDADAEQLLAARCAAGDGQARNRLVESNLWFVVSVASHYGSNGVPLVDLISEGNIALVDAAKNYEPGHAGRFATYARPYIQHACSAALAAAAGLPEYLHADRQRVKRIERYAECHSVTFTAAELAAQAKIPYARLLTIQGLPSVPVSLDLPEHSYDVPDVSDTTRLDHARRDALLDAIPRLMAQHLSQRERLVLSCRYGLGELAGKTMTQMATADMLARLEPPKVARATIGRIERRALGKLQTAFTAPVDLSAIFQRQRTHAS